MYNFIVGFLLGKRYPKQSKSLYPSKKTLDRHNQVFNYVKNNPYSSCKEIALNLNLSCSDVNASIIKLWKEKKLHKTEDKKYYI